MEVEQAEFFEFAASEVFCHGEVGFELLDKVGVIATGVLVTLVFHGCWESGSLLLF
jgi:hypothetical protein